MLNLPNDIAEACAPLFEALPLDEAMPHLLGSHPNHITLMEEVLSNPVVGERPELVAALWLYVDDLERSHTVSQSIEDRTGSFWHGIMHRREGDFSNSLYWFRRADGHPLLIAQPEIAPERLVADVSRAQGEDAGLLKRQREEWQALFEWCATNK